MLYREKLEEMRQRFPDTWDYYRIQRDYPLRTYFEAPSDFISRTFRHAEKTHLVPKLDGYSALLSEGSFEARAAHSVSTLLLGAALAQQFCNGDFLSFQTEYSKSRPYAEPYTFSYLWTMLALYHDIGYCLERDESLVQGALGPCAESSIGEGRPDAKRVVGRLLRTLDIQPTIYDKSLVGHWRGNRVQASSNIDYLASRLICEYYKRPRCLYAGNQLQPIIFPTRTREDIERYALFRLTAPSQNRDRKACVDHGIFGGYLLFDHFIKNYIHVYQEVERDHTDVDFAHFSYNEKTFDFDQLTVFAYLADCIMNHNIWRQEVDSEDGRICRKIGLYSVVGANYERVCLTKNPLLFILALADSLEPYKLFCAAGIDSHHYDIHELWDIFDQTEFAVHGNVIRMKVPRGKETYFSAKLESMKVWLEITTRCEDETFIITPKLPDEV